MPYVSPGIKVSNLMPTVYRDEAGKFRKLTDDMKRRYRIVLARSVDDFTNSIAARSLVEVPKGPRGDDEVGSYGELASSIRYPGNDPFSSAKRDAEVDSNYMSASISYNTPYADVQHEGRWTFEHHHPIIPGRQGFFEKTSQEAEIVIEWEARDYTTPGTKDHYLSDPFKAAISYMEKTVGFDFRTRMGLV